MYQSVIFDLDGTLVNSLYDLAGSMNKALAANGLQTHSTEKYKQFVGNGRTQLVRRAIGKARLTDSLLAEVTHAFDSDYAVHCMDQTKPYGGIVPLLQALAGQGVQICVLSNKPDRFVRQMMRELFAGVSFAKVWGKKEEFAPKPDPAAVFAMLKETGCMQKDCLYVGDSDVDVYTAQNAGIAFCGVEWGFRGRRELLSAGAAVTVDTPEKLLEVIFHG